MGSHHDTDELTGPPRSATDPSFPGPITPRSLAAAEPVAPEPAAPAAPAEVTPAPVPPKRPSDGVANLRPPSDPPRRGHTESIDELIDGLAGDGQLPRKSKSGRPRAPGAPPSDTKIAAAARKPQPPAPPPEALPSILVREATPAPDDGLSDDEIDGDRRSDPTVLTPTVLARRTRAQTWIAAVMGIVVALVVLAFLRSLTRSGDEAVAPASTQASASSTPVAPPVTAVTTVAAPTSASAVPVAAASASERVLVAAPVAPAASTVRAASPVTSASPVRSAVPVAPARPSSELEDFRKTIRQ